MTFTAKTSVLFGAALFAAAASMPVAFAQNTPRSVEVSAAPLSNAITYSEPGSLPNTKPVRPALDSYVGYLVTITNKSGNTINKVRFEPTWAASTTSSTPLPLVASFVQDTGSPCLFDSSAAQGVVCPLGQLQAQSPTTTFVIFFKSPDKPSPEAFGEFRLTGKVYFAEGTKDDPTAPNSSSDLSPAVLVSLGTANPTEVKSGVRKAGGSVFTGASGVPTDVDRNASLLRVPGLGSSYGYGFSKLKETELGTAGFTCPPALPNCLARFDVNVTDKDGGTKLRFAPAEQVPPVPVTNVETQYLVITLRRDDSLFTGSINKVNIYYNDGTGWSTVDPCAQVPDPLFGINRCILDRRVLKNSDPEVKENPALQGVAQIKIIAKENGEFAW